MSKLTLQSPKKHLLKQLSFFFFFWKKNDFFKVYPSIRSSLECFPFQFAIIQTLAFSPPPLSNSVFSILPTIAIHIPNPLLPSKYCSWKFSSSSSFCNPFETSHKFAPSSAVSFFLSSF